MSNGSLAWRHRKPAGEGLQPTRSTVSPPPTGGGPERALSGWRPAGRTADPARAIGRSRCWPTVWSHRRFALCREYRGRGLARSRVQPPQAARSALDRVGWPLAWREREDATNTRQSRTTGATSGALGPGSCPHDRCRFSDGHDTRGTAGLGARVDRKEHHGGDQARCASPRVAGRGARRGLAGHDQSQSARRRWRAARRSPSDPIRPWNCRGRRTMRVLHR